MLLVVQTENTLKTVLITVKKKKKKRKKEKRKKNNNKNKGKLITAHENQTI